VAPYHICGDSNLESRGPTSDVSAYTVISRRGEKTLPSRTKCRPGNVQNGGIRYVLPVANLTADSESRSQASNSSLIP